MEEEEMMTIKPTEIWVTKFDEEHAQKFRDQVLAVSRTDPSRPVVVYIDSYGGYVDALAKMIETLDEIPNPVVTACMGKAMSCGAVLLSHGDVRFLGKHSRVMVHEVSSGTGGNVHDMKVDVAETTRLNEHFMTLLAKNCGFKDYNEFRSVLKQADGTDRYLVGNEAMAFGIVDAIGTPKVSGRMLYEVSKQKIRVPMETRNKQTLLKSKGKKKPLKGKKTSTPKGKSKEPKKQVKTPAGTKSKI